MPRTIRASAYTPPPPPSYWQCPYTWTAFQKGACLSFMPVLQISPRIIPCVVDSHDIFSTLFLVWQINKKKIPTPFVSFWRHPCNSGWVPFGRLKTSKMCLKALPTSNGTRKLNQVLSFGKFFSLEIFKTNYHLIIESLSNIGSMYLSFWKRIRAN